MDIVYVMVAMPAILHHQASCCYYGTTSDTVMTDVFIKNFCVANAEEARILIKRKHPKKGRVVVVLTTIDVI